MLTLVSRALFDLGRRKQRPADNIDLQIDTTASISASIAASIAKK
jgi:hypothetical protein